MGFSKFGISKLPGGPYFQGQTVSFREGSNDVSSIPGVVVAGASYQSLASWGIVGQLKERPK